MAMNLSVRADQTSGAPMKRMATAKATATAARMKLAIDIIFCCLSIAPIEDVSGAPSALARASSLTPLRANRTTLTVMMVTMTILAERRLP